MEIVKNKNYNKNIKLNLSRKDVQNEKEKSTLSRTNCSNHFRWY